MISLDGREFTDPKVVRKITSILKTMFNGSWTTWKEVDKSGHDELWAHFKNGYQRFTDPKVVRKITSILKTMFNGSWTTWKEVDKSGHDELWAHFKELFKWEGLSDVLVHDAWENSMKKCYPDIMLYTMVLWWKNMDQILLTILSMMMTYRNNVSEMIRKNYLDSVRRELKEELKEEMKAGLKEEMKADLKEEMKNDLKEEMHEELKEEIRKELKE
nr:hypothetical protein [Tanacetum cinerariifolium]